MVMVQTSKSSKTNSYNATEFCISKALLTMASDSHAGQYRTAGLWLNMAIRLMQTTQGSPNSEDQGHLLTLEDSLRRLRADVGNEDFYPTHRMHENPASRGQRGE